MTDTDCAITEAPETPSEECQEMEEQQSNVDSSLIDEETKEKLKGDQIGDTMYKQSFVIVTLMRFSNPEKIASIWDEELETDMNFMWDMTIEPSVGQLLFELGFPSIACTILQSEVPQRLKEILIGILGNICTPSNASKLDPQHLNIILQQFDTDDHLMLLQLMRFVKVIAYKSDDCSFISEDVMEKIIFILFNSINVALLEASLDAVGKLTSEKKLPCDNLHENLLESSFSAFKVICESENDSETSQPHKTEIVKRNLNYLLQILVNLSVYCNDDDTNGAKQVKIIRDKVNEHKEVVFNELLDVLKNYTDEFDNDKITICLMLLVDSVRKLCSHETFSALLCLLKCQLVKLRVNEELRETVLSMDELTLDRLLSNIHELIESINDDDENVPVCNILANLQALFQ